MPGFLPKEKTKKLAGRCSREPSRGLKPSGHDGYHWLVPSRMASLGSWCLPWEKTQKLAAEHLRPCSLRRLAKMAIKVVLREVISRLTRPSFSFESNSQSTLGITPPRSLKSFWLAQGREEKRN